MLWLALLVVLVGCSSPERTPEEEAIIEELEEAEQEPDDVEAGSVGDTLPAFDGVGTAG